MNETPSLGMSELPNRRRPARGKLHVWRWIALLLVCAFARCPLPRPAEIETMQPYSVAEVQP